MAGAFKVRGYPITKLPNSSRGYILITLMLFVTLLAIAAMAVAPAIAHQIQRDREEEMMHRAVAYARGVRNYYKKFGRYPTRLEDLENTNNLRFIRKRYKDPITGQDFKILHMSDVLLNNGPGLAGASGFVGAAGGGIRQAGPGDSNVPQVTGLPGTPNAGGPTGSPKTAGDDSGDSSGTQQVTGSSASSSSSSSGFNGPVFGGGPILGVASASKNTSIRECNKKNHYNDWLFIYDPTTDRGGLLNTCWQQGTLQGIGGAGAPAGIPGQQQQPNAVPGVAPQRQPNPSPNPDPMPPEQ
jgi:type II secretory pathway pseudopilin PulG